VLQARQERAQYRIFAAGAQQPGGDERGRPGAVDRQLGEMRGRGFGHLDRRAVFAVLHHELPAEELQPEPGVVIGREAGRPLAERSAGIEAHGP